MILALQNRAVVERSIDELRPHDKNPRTHSKRQIDQIAKSIKRFGFVNPVLLDNDGNILAGHGRIAAAKSLGLASVPTLDIGSMSDAERRAYIVADNRLAELAGWDSELLGLEMEAILEAMPDLDIGAMGFDDGELDALLAAGDDPAENDQIPQIDPDKSPVSRTGDAIRDCSTRNGSVLDLFSGSGTTIIAAERTGRRCYAMELDPLYVDVAIRRWEAETGREAVHLKHDVSFAICEALEL